MDFKNASALVRYCRRAGFVEAVAPAPLASYLLFSEQTPYWQMAVYIEWDETYEVDVMITFENDDTYQELDPYSVVEAVEYIRAGLLQA